jgi:predicted O-methyltransferase YrrM
LRPFHESWYRGAVARGILIDSLRCANLATLRLALRNVDAARAFCSTSARRYDELMGRGLKRRNPIDFLCTERGLDVGDARCELPIVRRDGGVTSPAESVTLAAVTRVLQPRRVFEIGTFIGQTTSLLIVNAPVDAEVFSLDLPENTDINDAAYIDTDIALVKRRHLARVVHELGLTARYTQLLGDSLAFDPSPFANSINLGFIDGAHALPYVKNDTEKMARMIVNDGIVFWHDYGGAGRFGDLTRYLEGLARRIPVYRVPNTTLAWTSGDALRASIEM